MASEAFKAYQQYMSGSAGSNNTQQQQRGQQGQQPGANAQNPYVSGFGAHMQQVPQGLQNPYASQQQYLQANPVSKADIFPFPPPYTRSFCLSKLGTALAPARFTDRKQFARAHVPPAAPTPPPAVPPTLASSASLAHHGQLQPYIPQGPPAVPQARSQGYVDLPRSYNPPQQTSFPESWQYNQAPPQNHLVYSDAPAMAPTQTEPAYQSKDWSFERTREHNRTRYTGQWPPPDIVRIPSPQLPAKNVFPLPDVPPLALCHVCSVCGQMRSAGYHRHHPIIPGQALISSACRRCKKRARKAKERRDKERRKQEDAKESSERIITIKIDDGERRGRPRGREDRPHSLSSEDVVYRTRSRTNAGLRDSTRVEYRTRRDISPERSPPRALRRRTRSEVRVSSMSPHRDGAPIHYRRVEEYERQRSPSPDAKARLAAHPTAFRTFTPTQIPGYYPDDSHSPQPAPRRGILKPSTRFFEPQPARHMMEASYDSMLPEVGGNHVQFRREPRLAEHVRESYARCVICKSDHCKCDDEYAYRNHRRYHYQRGHVEEIPSPEIPTRRLEELRVREESPRPSQHRRYEADELHLRHVNIDAERHESREERLPPTDDRGRTRYPRAELRREASPLRRATSQVQELGRRVRETFSRSRTPPPNRKQADWDDATDSGSEASG